MRISVSMIRIESANGIEVTIGLRTCIGSEQRDTPADISSDRKSPVLRSETSDRSISVGKERRVTPGTGVDIDYCRSGDTIFRVQRSALDISGFNETCIEEA